MFSKTLHILACCLLGCVLLSCGSEPDVPRDRDVTFSTTTMNHVDDLSDGSARLAGLGACDVLLRRSALRADITLNVDLDGSGTAQRLTLTDVPMRTVDDTFCYAIDASTTSNPRVTHLKGTIDPTETAVLLSFTVDGRYLVATSMTNSVLVEGHPVVQAQIFYNHNSVQVVCPDKTTFSNGTLVEYHVNPVTLATEVHILDLTIASEYLIYRHLIGTDLTLDVTLGGYAISGDFVPLTGDASHSTGSDGTLQVSDRCLTGFHAELDLLTGQQHATAKLCRIDRRIEEGSEIVDIIPIADLIISGTTY